MTKPANEICSNFCAFLPIGVRPCGTPGPNGYSPGSQVGLPGRSGYSPGSQVSQVRMGYGGGQGSQVITDFAMYSQHTLPSSRCGPGKNQF